MRRLLIAKILGLLLIGKAYAIQIDQRPPSISTAVSTAESQEVAEVCPSLLPSPFDYQTVAREAVATKEPGPIQPSVPVACPTETSTAFSRPVETSKESVRPVSKTVHEKQSSRQRPLSQDGKTEEPSAQLVQLCNRASSRFGRTGDDGCTVSQKVEALARTIARAEGFFIKKTLPNRLHNPGDITVSAVKYPGQIGSYRGYAVFKNDRYGWLALKAQIQKIIDGEF